MAKVKATPKVKAKVKAKPAKPAKKPRVSTHPMKVHTAETRALTERVRRICMELPEATEKIAWGEYTWRAPKIFAMTDTFHHGSAHFSVHLPAPPGAQAALVDSDPDRFFRPPYTGGAGWIGVVLDTDPDWEMVASLVRTAYDLIRGH
ncbi:MAG TPA: MmcQ/YjbR family DNA-binding protein [Kofleriaceae bacterium]|nr:MmcQ/YjbR family DNA-binding protein [Kofleriaceae bacterium]